MATERIKVTLTADTSKFTEAMRRLQERVNAMFRVQASRDTRQVVCPGDRLNPKMHEFWITRGYACPGCGAAL